MLRNVQVSYILIFKKDLSEQRLFLIKIMLIAGASKLLKLMGYGDKKVKSTLLMKAM